MYKLAPSYQRLLTRIVKILLVVVVVVLVLTKVLGYVAPFVIALILTFMIERPVSFIQKKARLPRGVAVAISLFLSMLVFGGAVVLIFYKITLELWRLTKEINIQDLQGYVEYFQSLVVKSRTFYDNLPPEYMGVIEKNLGTFQENLDTLINQIPGWLTDLFNAMMNILKMLPQAFIFIIISLVATFFMSRDRDKISRVIFKQLPPSWASKVRSIKGDLFVALIGFMKAQMILISITFVELLIGYQILGIKYAFFFAVLTAIVDALPVLGAGTVLIPVVVIQLVMGNVPRAFSFLTLYVIILVVRQFLEPRVVGESIGLHPLVTLLFIYLGLQFFGVVGLVLGPLVAIIIKALQKARILPQWKS